MLKSQAFVVKKWLMRRGDAPVEPCIGNHSEMAAKLELKFGLSDKEMGQSGIGHKAKVMLEFPDTCWEGTCYFPEVGSLRHGDRFRFRVEA